MTGVPSLSTAARPRKVHPCSSFHSSLSRDNLPIALVKEIHQTPKHHHQNSGSHWNRLLSTIHNGRRRSHIPPGGGSLQQVCRDDECVHSPNFAMCRQQPQLTGLSHSGSRQGSPSRAIPLPLPRMVHPPHQQPANNSGAMGQAKGQPRPRPQSHAYRQVRRTLPRRSKRLRRKDPGPSHPLLHHWPPVGIRSLHAH